MKNKSILLEFTPLLDVILLILFLVLMQSEVRVDMMYTEVQDLMDEGLANLEQEFGEEMEALRQDSMELDAIRFGLNEDTGVIIINLLPASMGGPRRITVEADITNEITLSWDRLERDTASRELTEVIANTVQNSGHAFSFIIFRYDGRTIYDADRMLIRLAIHNHQLTNPRMFSAELDSRY